MIIVMFAWIAQYWGTESIWWFDKLSKLYITIKILRTKAI